MNWGVEDFLLAAILLAGVTFVIRLLLGGKLNIRIAIIVLLILILVWVELGVGIFGTLFAGG